ncbi:hypothetical protein HPB47_018387 [Ixodes persulcatus]|uniref:Uncharacterized protein n=1 Tax=Ixodes persulcatus TaxID=34615 RepID=A0AC60QKU3_IXOPE|nr:hypothetical protein HPB47_018387 [Ixodes persulcatus]
MAFGARIGEFDLGSGSSREVYVQRVELCCAANKLVTDIKRRAALLSYCGQDTYSLISILIKPLQPPNVECRTIVDAIKNHVNPRPSELYARYAFSKRDQNDGESVASYVTELHKLAENCGFSDTQLPLSIILRDRLVFGVADAVVQQRLLAEKSLTFEAAYDIAVAAEVTTKQQKDMSTKGSDKESKEDVTARVST